MGKSPCQAGAVHIDPPLTPFKDLFYKEPSVLERTPAGFRVALTPGMLARGRNPGRWLMMTIKLPASPPGLSSWAALQDSGRLWSTSSKPQTLSHSKPASLALPLEGWSPHCGPGEVLCLSLGLEPGAACLTGHGTTRPPRDSEEQAKLGRENTSEHCGCQLRRALGGELKAEAILGVVKGAWRSLRWGFAPS